ncbi:hypothetical protein KC906_04605 [Candidatus Kaiserbacteria bacterium]|nr:hypothetical protein [Candidatus Kaiserbacteria bacterium]
MKKHTLYITLFISGLIISGVLSIVFFGTRTGCDSEYNKIQNTLATLSMYSSGVLAVVFGYFLNKKFYSHWKSYFSSLLLVGALVSLFGYISAAHIDYSDQMHPSSNDCLL